MKKIFISIIAIVLSNLTYAQLIPMSIGTIEAGDSIMIYYSVQMNDTSSQFISIGTESNKNESINHNCKIIS